MSTGITRKTLVDQLVESLSRDIFLGTFEADATLPPLRTLARDYGVTVPTTQRAIARIEEMGLLEVRHGSGMRVLEPREHAGLSAYPYWVDALRARPEEARRILADFLELRRELAIALLRRVRDVVGRDEFSPVMAAVESMAAIVERKYAQEEVVAADRAIARALLQVRPQAAYAMIFNVFERMLVVMPEIASAMYADPRANLASWRLLFELMEEHEDFVPMIEPLIEHVDEVTLDAFERALRGE